MKLMNKFSAALLAGVALLSASPSEAQADGFHDPFGFHPPFQNFWLPPGFWPPQPQVLLPDLVIANVFRIGDTKAYVKVSNIGEAIANPSTVMA